MVKKIVLVGGCFDLLHFGHLQFLKAAKKQGNYLIVALESDEFIRRYKYRQPFHTQAQRAAILKQLRVVDKVINLKLLETYTDYLNLVKKIKPDIIALTKGDKQIKNKKKQAKIIGAKVKIVTDIIENLSTSTFLLRKIN